jgi:hypothetical protein
MLSTVVMLDRVKRGVAFSGLSFSRRFCEHLLGSFTKSVSSYIASNEVPQLLKIKWRYEVPHLVVYDIVPASKHRSCF